MRVGGFFGVEGFWRLGVWDKIVLKKFKIVFLYVRVLGVYEDCGRLDLLNFLEVEGWLGVMNILLSFRGGEVS